MDLFEAVRARYSYRGSYRDARVPRADLERIVAAGMAAPSGKNLETTRFVIVDDPELLAGIRGLHPRMKAMQEAPAYVACVIDREPEAAFEHHHFQIEDAAAAVQNMLLAITALGYASVWVDGWLRYGGHAEAVGALLGVPEDKVVRILLPVGVPVAPGRRPDKLGFVERVGINRYER
jgi:nitroreductase